jgi:hypothetical protein
MIPRMMQHATPEPLTMFDKIWMRHRVLEREDGQVLLYVDRHFIHDGTAPAFEMLRKRGVAPRRGGQYGRCIGQIGAGTRAHGPGGCDHDWQYA